MVVAPALVPKAALFFASITPALNVVKPVKVLVPPNIKVSVLNLVNPPDPEITASMRIPLLTSVVNVKLPVLIPPVRIINESAVEVPVERILPPALPMVMRPV